MGSRGLEKPVTSLSSKWGAVGLLINWRRSNEGTNSSDLEQIKERWSALINQDEQNRRNYQKVATSNARLSKGGLLEIEWPKSTDGFSLELDLILATANSPTLVGERPTYPDTMRIANAWIRACKEYPSNKYDEYFWKNVTNGITTLQDEEIIRRLNSGS